MLRSMEHFSPCGDRERTITVGSAYAAGTSSEYTKRLAFSPSLVGNEEFCEDLLDGTRRVPDTSVVLS